MEDLFTIRQQFGGVFTTHFPEGLSIPWKPLSLKDYLSYLTDYSRGIIPSSILENEIFKKSVLDDNIISKLPHLKAGIVTTVVQNIWQYSGPTGIEAFNKDLEEARNKLFEDSSKIIHELVQLITMAYPYKPEEVYSMDYETFMFRLAMSEKKLLDMGIIKEPISMTVQSDKSPPSTKAPPKPQVDAKRLWEDQQAKQKKVQVESKETKSSPTPSTAVKGKWFKESPVLETAPTHGINFDLEGKETDVFGLTGHEKADAHLSRAKLIKDSQTIYKDLLKKLADKKKTS
jgi:hypothetical protein